MSGEVQYYQCYAYCELFEDLEDADADAAWPTIDPEYPECLPIEPGGVHP